MRIGQLSEKARVSIQTLRFYEREGLVPEPPRTLGGYRVYSENDVLRVRFIRDAQELGFTLKEIRELVTIHEAQCRALNNHTKIAPAWREAFRIAQERLALIDQKIEELRTFRARLAAGLENASRKDYQVCPAASHPRTPAGKTAK